MRSVSLRRLTGAVLLAVVALAVPAAAQVHTLWYKEEAYSGRIYVFNTPTAYAGWSQSREIGVSITKLGYGPAGETVVFENETAIDLYDLKHGKDSDVRPYAPPKAPSAAPPTSLKIGDGELKFGLLLQGWYVTDDSPAATGSSWLGNTTGYNSFRLRRAEIKLNGRITKDWGFEVMFDPAKGQNFSSSSTDGKILQDLAVVYLGLKGHEFALGQKKIVITEEGVRSSSELDFAERAQVTRNLSDRRETGFFYKGEYGEMVTGWASVSNGTAANTNSDTNDTIFAAGRVDLKPVHGLLVGASGGTGAVNGGSAHNGRSRYGAHVKYDGGEDLPIGFRVEYMKATDEQGPGKADLNRDGFYGTLLYTFDRQYQLAVRYDEFNNNKDADGNKVKTFTAGFHYLIKGKNINLKLDYFKIKQENRKVNGALDETYGQFVLAAQVAF